MKGLSAPFKKESMKKLYLISRQKLSGMGKHYGVLLSNERCLDFHPQGITESNLKEFSKGLEVQIEISLPETKESYRRLEELKKNKKVYNLIDFNCENFARYLAEGKSESRQVFIASALIILFGGIWIFQD